MRAYFKIIDGASGPMQRMERQAKKTDKSIENLGERLDNVGSDKQLKQMDNVDRQIRSIDRDARTFASNSGGGGRLRSTLRGAGDDADNFSSKLVKVGLNLAAVGKVFKALKLPLIIAGVVALVQGISALGGGLVALLPKLVDVAGVAGALPATFAGIGIAAVSAKLALGGLGPALKGTKGAMADLTPRAREFVRVLRELKPLGRSLRNSAQAGLFPGLTNALGSLQGGAGVARRLLRRGGETLGGIAERAAGQVTQSGFLRDFESVGNQGLGVLNRLGSGLMNVVQALRHVAVAAEPFTDWLSKTVVGWTALWEQSALAARRTGELDAYFDRTRSALERFGSILENLWGTLRGIGRAARPLGDDLWQSADKATARWEAFANSLAGQQTLRDYFEGLKENIHAIFEFTGELSEAFVELGSSGGFTSTAKALTDAIAPLQDLFQNIGEHYGPVLARTLEQLILLFDNLGGGSFAILNLLEGVNLLLEGINKLLEKIPMLSNLIVGVLGAAALNSLGARLRGIAADWGLIATNAGRAAAAQRSAGMPVVGGGPIPGRAGPGSPGTFIGGVGVPKVLGGRGIGYSTTYQQARSLGYSRSLSSVAQAGALGIGGIRGVFGGLKAAGRFLGPAAAVLAGLGFVTRGGNLAERTSAALSQGSFGLIPEVPTTDEVGAEALERAQGSVQHLLGEVPQNRKGLRYARIIINRQRRNLRAESEGGSDQMQAAASAALPYYASVAEQLKGQLANRSRSAGAKAAEDFTEAWRIRLEQEDRREAGGAMLGPLLKKMGSVGPQGARILAQANLKMFRQISKDNPKLQGLYESATDAIEAKFEMMGETVKIVNGRIFTGSKTEWKNISEAISSQAARALDETSDAFKAMEEEAIGSLMAMGFSRPAARSIVKGLHKGGADAHTARANQAAGPVLGGTAYTPPSHASKLGAEHAGHRARGGRVAGFGNQDRYALGGGAVGAAGELLINKHTERDADRMLGMFGTSLGKMVAGEGRPHSELVYGARGARVGGGIESVGRYASGMGLSVSEGPGYGGVPSEGHASGSLHYSGLAYDVSGAPELMRRFRVAAERRYLGHGLNELFYDPYPYYIDAGNKVPGAIGEHSDHVHIGFFPGGPSGASAVKGLLGGGGFRPVKARRSALGGVPGALANSAMGAFAAGLNQRLASKAGAALTPSIPRFGGGGGILGMAQLQRLAAGAGMANPHLMAAIAMAESSGNPNVTNSIGARGLWQIIPSTAAAFGLDYGRLTNPAYNAFGAAKILKGQGLGAWEGYTNGAYQRYMSHGGRIPGFAGWFGGGGTITASGPTLLGIGESGTEVAKVTPKGRGRAGGGSGIQIGTMKIENHRPGDVRKQIKKEVGEAFNELADELDLTPDTDDTEVLG